MSSRLIESILGGGDDLSQLHRRVVRVGAAAAWCAAAFFMVGYVVGGDEAMLLEALGPALAAGLMTAQILLKAENGGVALFGSAVVVLALHSVIGGPRTDLPAALALVVICAVGVLLLESRQATVMTLLGLGLFFAPQIWDSPAWPNLGLVMTLSFAMTSAIFLSLRAAASSLDTRYQMLFESSPAAMMEENWSEALAYVKEEYTGRPDRIESFLLAYPAVVRRAVDKTMIIRVNQAAIDLLEARSAEDLVGPRAGAKVADENIEAYASALATAYRGEKSFARDMPVRTLKGRRIWIQARGVDTSTREPASTILVGLADVTHIKTRQEAMTELVRAKDEFVAKVSHELRTPLTAVLGLTTEMSAMEPMSPEERAELLGLVTDQAQEMSNIVEDLLVASRAEIGTVSIHTRVVDLEVELQSAIEGLGVQVAEVPDSIPEAYADPGRVRQILRNLLTNAMRYGGPGIRVLSGAVDRFVWLEVRDDGEGVPDDQANTIFEPYSTAHHGVKGSVGLGLSVSRQLAELMRGSLTYRRDLDESVFRLELPIAGDSDRASPLHRVCAAG